MCGCNICTAGLDNSNISYVSLSFILSSCRAETLKPLINRKACEARGGGAYRSRLFWGPVDASAPYKGALYYPQRVPLKEP